MECTLHHLVLLLGLLSWAAAATGAGAQPSCDPSSLATEITLYCKADMPSESCCGAVIASVGLGGGGSGVPCLCRVTAQPQLVLTGFNASHLLALYSACGGLDIGPSCQGSSPPAAVPVITPPPAVPTPPHSGSDNGGVSSTITVTISLASVILLLE